MTYISIAHLIFRLQYLVVSQYSVQYVKKTLWLDIDKTDPYNRNSLAMEG